MQQNAQQGSLAIYWEQRGDPLVTSSVQSGPLGRHWRVLRLFWHSDPTKRPIGFFSAIFHTNRAGVNLNPRIDQTPTMIPSMSIQSNLDISTVAPFFLLAAPIGLGAAATL
jgi:hypothetical protein